MKVNPTVTITVYFEVRNIFDVLTTNKKKVGDLKALPRSSHSEDGPFRLYRLGVFFSSEANPIRLRQTRVFCTNLVVTFVYTRAPIENTVPLQHSVSKSILKKKL
jgi:hypothetical protein